MERAFDFIVIGSGSAGAALAARLSEDPHNSVLLLEAGPRDRHPLQLMPLAFTTLATSKFGTWQYQTEPEQQLYGRTLPTPRGRILGGTSSINAMIAVRGNCRDYDRWADAGCTGWSYDEVLPLFKRLERSWRGAGEYHGGDGPVQISRMEGPELLWEPLLQSAEAAGVEHNQDAHALLQDGISRMESTVAHGKRSSTARAYLYPAKQRPNLTIETGALANRLVIENGRATCVSYLQRGQKRTAKAAREIILCGGSFNSPQLLMLSGIGPADHLRETGVEVVHDLPAVGQNLADHPNIINDYVLASEAGLTRHLRIDRAVIGACRWMAGGLGPFAYTGTAANVFARTLDGIDQPDVQMMCLPISNSTGLWVPGFQAKPDFMLSVRCGFLHPKSRGWVKLRSTDPFAPPRIWHNIFDDPGDLEGMVRALKLARSIYAQSPIADMIAHENLPGGDVQSDDNMREYIRRNATLRSHPVGTCKMGVGDDAVVDPQLRVHGIDGLRIADCRCLDHARFARRQYQPASDHDWRKSCRVDFERDLGATIPPLPCQPLR